MYCHVRISLDKPALYDAVRECFKNSITGAFKFAISDLGNDKFLLTPRQQQQLREVRNQGFSTALITCFHNQIIQYAHSCIDKPTLLRILDGENP